MQTRLAYADDNESLIINALHCLEIRLRYHSALLNHSKDVRAYLRLHLAEEENETFAVLFLNNQCRLLAFEKLFRGTLHEVIAYPRIVVQKALQCNAAKVILAHNHPGEDCTPSSADKEITETIRQALDLVDTKVVDHWIVSHRDSYSFAENGLL
jgi:DNA repair protein RadC